MKIRWLALIVIIIPAVCIGLGCVSSSETSSHTAVAAQAMNIPQAMPVTFAVA